MLQFVGLTVSLLMGVAATPENANSSVYALKDGDRVVFLGNTLIERAAQSGYIETQLTLANPDANITFRNLGWSGDTVWAESRAGFDTPVEGFERLRESVLIAKPTLIFVGYGGNEAYAGARGIPNFVAGLRRLLQVLGETEAKIVFLSPIRHEDLGRPLPDPQPHNKDLRLYADTMRTLAQRKGLGWIELEPALSVQAVAQPSLPLTSNGMHLNDYGYWRAAEIIAQRGSHESTDWQVAISADGKVNQASGTQVDEVSSTDGRLKWTALDDRLPAPLNPHTSSESSGTSSAERLLQVTGLAEGDYQLSIDGEPVRTATASEWKAGVSLTAGPEFAATEELRRVILKKNELFFYRWRPQNTTYLFGFRKHEQGNNAAEVAEFDPLVADEEQKIAQLRKPVEHVYELTRNDGDN